jgi:hypothetical protein
MRVLLICAFLSAACSTTIEAKRPLTPEKIDELRSATGSRRVKVESAAAVGAPLVLELSDIDFAPEFLQGNAAEGVQTIPLSRVATVSWRSGAKGALLGLLVGAFFGGGLGTAIATGLPHQSETNGLQMLAGFAGGALIGLLVGPVIGALIGAEKRIEFTPPGPTLATPPRPLQAPNPNTN